MILQLLKLISSPTEFKPKYASLQILTQLESLSYPTELELLDYCPIIYHFMLISEWIQLTLKFIGFIILLLFVSFHNLFSLQSFIIPRLPIKFRNYFQFTLFH